MSQSAFVSVLLEVPDPVRRSRAHLALGEQALAMSRPEVAREHLEEAVDLDPTDPTARKLLAQLSRSRRRFFSLFD